LFTWCLENGSTELFGFGGGDFILVLVVYCVPTDRTGIEDCTFIADSVSK
jgi:hypothetical protein